MEEPCHACGSYYTWGCPWCSPRRSVPVRSGYLPKREDDEHFVKFLKRGMLKARQNTEKFNPSVEETV